MFALTMLAFLVILGLLVFVHELGHFTVAKLSGVKVEEFAFGFPPKIYCKKKGDTKYCINAIPFGGYVKMLGEDNVSKSPVSFGEKSVSKRFSIVVAGVLMNFVLAGVLFSIGYMVGMAPTSLNVENYPGKYTKKILVAQVNANSPASIAGLKENDELIGFNSIDELVSYSKANAGKQITVSVLRSGTTLQKTIDVSTNAETPMGIGIVNVPSLKLGFFAAIGAGFKDMVLTIGNIAKALYEFFVGLFMAKNVAGDVAGPIGIFNITGQAVKMGITYLIQLAAILSINLGLINILPFPALDGGRALIIVLEGIFRKKIIKAEVENLLHTIGFAIIILLIIAVTYKDIVSLF
jgi:regulator of sigma E protease